MRIPWRHYVDIRNDGGGILEARIDHGQAVEDARAWWRRHVWVAKPFAGLRTAPAPDPVWEAMRRDLARPVFGYDPEVVAREAAVALRQLRSREPRPGWRQVTVNLGSSPQRAPIRDGMAEGRRYHGNGVWSDAAWELDAHRSQGDAQDGPLVDPEELES